MLISIIIPTYNRVNELTKCLTALLKTNSDDFEIIIVNDASSDGTKEYLDKLNNPKIKAIHHEINKGVSESRNDGIKLSKSEIIAFTDDDCEPQDGWLLNLVKNFTDDTIDFVFGPTYHVHPSHKGYFPERRVNIINWPGGGNIAYRKKVFDAAGSFDVYFKKYNNEDSEMAIRAINHGFKSKYEPTAICHHAKSYWQIKTLLNSAQNASVWPILKKKYPKHYLTFKPPILLKFIAYPKDYIFLFTLPISIPLILIRYLYHDQTDLKIFFAKWPIYLILRRYYIYKEAIKNRVLML